MPRKLPEHLKSQALDLRIKKRLSLQEVCDQLGVSRGTASTWLRDHPLTDVERRERMSQRGGRAPRVAGPESRLHKLLDGRSPDRVAKARIAEAATLLRVVLMGWGVYGSTFDGAKFDWIVNTGERLVRLQVKSMRQGRAGSPYTILRCADGRGKSRKYREGEFDFVVGYDLFADTAYVWSWVEVEGKATISAHPDAAEAWGKIKG